LGLISPTMTTSFDTKSITDIIETCSRNGVARFSYGGLELSFLQVDKAPVTEPVFVRPEIQAAQNSQAKDSLTKEEALIKANTLEQMLLDDPLEYENLLRTREIE
jgi:hypothetical protein